MRILITGYSGYLGSHLTKNLEHHPLIDAIYVSSRTQSSNTNPKLQFVPYQSLIDGSFKDPIDCCVHFAAYRGNKQNELVKGSKEIELFLLHTFKLGIKKFIHASSQAIYGVQPTPWTVDLLPAPVTHYAWSKCIEEQSLSLIGNFYKNVATHSLRIAKLIGPGDRFRINSGEIPHVIADKILKNSPIILPRVFLNQQLDFLDVREAAKVIERLIFKSNDEQVPRIMNLSGHTVTGKELIELFDHYCHRNNDLKLDVRFITEEIALRNFGMDPRPLSQILANDVDSIPLKQTIDDIFLWLKNYPLP
jgi:nucleoside-diphosphate-sugar epimerase